MRPLVSAGSKPRLLFICIDSLNWDLAKTWARQGLLTNLGSCFAAQNSGKIRAGNGLPTSAVWQSIYTGITPNQLGFTQPEPFWVKISQQGLTVQIIDSPKYLEVSEVNGVWISKWYSHDSPGYEARTFPKLTLPPGYPQDFGKYEYERQEELVDSLLNSIDHKISTTLSLLENDWDFSAVFFSESHFVGHAFWPERLNTETLKQSPIFTIYKKLDDAIGELIAKTSSDVFIVSPQGMATNTSLNMIVPILLTEFEKANPSNGWVFSVREGLRNTNVKLINKMLNVLMPARSQRVICQQGSGFSAAIRINLEGREPEGIVAEIDYAALLEQLEAFFFALRDEATNQPVVSEIVHTSNKDSKMPDLLVIWSRIKRAQSIVGAFRGRVPAGFTRLREGEHTSEGGYLFLSRSKNMEIQPCIRDVDIAPFMLRYFSR